MKRKSLSSRTRRLRAAAPESPLAPPAGAPWTFLTNHSHVLLTLFASPELVMREVAARVGVTERTVQKIVEDLEDAGVLVSERVGRRKRYRIDAKAPLRHPVEAHRTVADILELVHEAGGKKKARRQP